MDDNSDRPGFEAWARSLAMSTDREPFPERHGYIASSTEYAWRGWQARYGAMPKAAMNNNMPTPGVLCDCGADYYTAEQFAAQYERAEAEGSRAVMLMRQRRRLQDDAKDALAHLTAAEALTANNAAISIGLCAAIRNAESLVRGMTQRLPNSPETEAA